ncbi:MAG: hypothetical protein WCX17_03815 [Parcubacteria group bacterium]|jgi:hypothetical protein
MESTYQGGEYSNSDLFGEVKEAAVREGVSTLVQYRDLIDEIVEEKRIYGFFSDDEDLSQVKENLEARWPEIEKGIIKR